MQVEKENYHATESDSPNFHGFYDGVNERNDKLYLTCFVKLHRLSSPLEDKSKIGSESVHLNKFNWKRNEIFHDTEMTM